MTVSLLNFNYSPTWHVDNSFWLDLLSFKNTDVGSCNKGIL